MFRYLTQNGLPAVVDHFRTGRRWVNDNHTFTANLGLFVSVYTHCNGSDSFLLAQTSTFENAA